MIKIKKFFFILIGLLLSAAAVGSPSKVFINTIDIKNKQNDFQIIFNVSAPPQYNAFVLHNPTRLVFDFGYTHLRSVNFSKLYLLNSAIKTIRIGFPKKNTLRLVFDMKKTCLLQSAGLKLRTQIKFDVLCKAPLTPLSFLKNSPGKLLTAPASNSFAIRKISPPTFKKNNLLPFHKVVIVVIDPGHGGHDPGAIGNYGVQEKNVVLAIAKKLAFYINQEPNMRAYMTRNGDYFVSLRNRLLFARSHKADLFVAIHADSHFNTKAEGASVFALSNHGATSVAAKWLAQRENHSELNNLTLNELEDQSYLLRSVLIDLAQTVTIRDSLRLANKLLDSLEKITQLHYSRVEQAPFMVLKSPDIPSILVETGFISNTKEERRLRERTYQNKIALALFQGIRAYQALYKV